MFYGPLVKYLNIGMLPSDQKMAKKVLTQSEFFGLVDEALVHISPDRHNSDLLVRPVLTEEDTQRVVARAHLDPKQHHLMSNKLLLCVLL